MIPTIVGGILATAGGFGAKFYNDFRERKSLRTALSAEVRSFLGMLDREKIEELFRKTLRKIGEMNRLPLFPVSFRGTYSTVFCGSASKLGFLDPCLLNKLVDYYYQIQTLLELSEIFSKNLDDISARDVQNDPKEIEEQTELLREMLTCLTEVRKVAIELVDQLDPAPN